MACGLLLRGVDRLRKLGAHLVCRLLLEKKNEAVELGDLLAALDDVGDAGVEDILGGDALVEGRLRVEAERWIGYQRRDLGSLGGVRDLRELLRADRAEEGVGRRGDVAPGR